MDSNSVTTKELSAPPTNKDEPLTYYQALSEIQKTVYESLTANGVIIVSEGANTMDIGRTLFPNEYPRTRLDAGTFGTMGVGFGFAIAAAIVYPDKRVLMIEGDSAFGFSAMEIETIMRYKLPVTCVIINNNGVSMGVDDITMTEKPLPHVYTTKARYEKLADTFGGKGWIVSQYDQIRPTIKAALGSECKSFNLVNVLISPYSNRKAQSFEWHTRIEKKETTASNL